jgi:hypothetical protein
VPSLSATQSFAVIVRDVNTPPTWLPIADQTVLPGDMLTVLPRGLLREVYDGIAGQAVSDLTNHVSYPAHPIGSGMVTNLVGLPYPGHGVSPGQGQRVRGYFAPPIDGAYGFQCWSAETLVLLSTDEHPQNKRRVWWTRANGSSGWSQLPLEAGKLYCFEVLSTGSELLFAGPLPGEGFFAPAATDADVPEDLLSYELVAGPEGASVEPYTGRVVWTPSPGQAPSTNVLTVKVSDDGTPNLSATQSFTVVVLENHPPGVSLVAPTNAAVFALGQTIRLEASASDVDGNLQGVKFLDGTNHLAEVTAPPFRFLWTNASAGSHTLTARARDRAGATTDSAPVTICLAGPPRLGPAQFISGQPFRLLLTGEARLQYLWHDEIALYAPGEYVIEASTNLLDWVPLATNAVSALGTWEFADMEATNFAMRFYRARQFPRVPTSVVWVDDALPAGAVPGADGGDSWNWISGGPPPFSGALANLSSVGAGSHQHYFISAAETLTVNTGAVLFAYVYLYTDSLPSEIMLQWNDGSWEHRAYWGADALPDGTDGTASRRYMGPLPASGQWVCLQVPASQVGLEGSVLNGMAFRLYDGRAAWDCAGRVSP